MNWFEVDRKGLRQVVKRRGSSFIAHELLQNAFDQNVSTVKAVMWSDEKNRGHWWVEVEDDDPNGFDDLKHAYTLFAETRKRANVERRGRFNIGEKLVIAASKKATISTTTGTISFSEKGRIRHRMNRGSGSVFSALFRLTRAEADELREAFTSVIPPEGVRYTFNNEPVTRPEILCVVSEILPTEIPDEAGDLRRSRRRTNVEMLSAPESGRGVLYEMGIPVCETGDAYSYNVLQRVPLNIERDGVTPAYLRKLRRLAAQDLPITTEMASEPWVTDSLEDPELSEEATEKILDQRFGKKRVTYDPSDPEANKIAVSKGYTLVHGSSLPSKAWDNVRQVQKPAGKVTPSAGKIMFDSQGKDVTYENITDAMIKVKEMSKEIAKLTIGREISVTFVNDPRGYGACFGGTSLTFNVRRLGKVWFETSNRENHINLIIHELGHYNSGDHLSADYYQALTMIGARLTLAAAEGRFHPRNYN